LAEISALSLRRSDPGSVSIAADMEVELLGRK